MVEKAEMFETANDDDVIHEWSEVYLREGQNPPIQKTWSDIKGLTLKRSRNGNYKYRTKVINLEKVLEVEGVVPKTVKCSTNRLIDVVKTDTDKNEANGGGGTKFLDQNTKQRREMDPNLDTTALMVCEKERRLEAGKAKLKEMMLNGGRAVRKVKRRRATLKVKTKGTIMKFFPKTLNSKVSASNATGENRKRKGDDLMGEQTRPLKRSISSCELPLNATRGGQINNLEGTRTKPGYDSTITERVKRETPKGLKKVFFAKTTQE